MDTSEILALQTTLERDGRGRREGGPDQLLVGVVTPHGRDAALVRARLAQAGLAAEVCPSIAALCDRLPQDDFGALLVTTEALGEGGLRLLARALQEQPPWSDIPLLLLAARKRPPARVLQRLGPLRLTHSVTVLERPVAGAVLESAVRAALRARARQHEVRWLLEQLGAANASLEHRVEERTHEVRRLARDLTMAEQEERHRIANLLHDHLQQLLYGLQIKLQLARAASGDAGSALDGADEVVRRAIGLTRTLTIDLSPPVLDGEGLGAVFSWLGAHMEELYGMRVDVEGDCATTAEHLRVLLYQMGRELLFNVVKHAGVDQASVFIGEEDGLCIIRIEDKGAGFDPASLRSAQQGEGGFGLHNVQERLNLLGGRLKLASRPGAGTRATIIAPLTLNEP